MVVQERKDNLPPKGLRNRGNTCFFNSAMQCILSIGELNTFYKNTDFPKEKVISNAFKQFISEYESRGHNDPKSLIDKLSTKIKLFNGMQQDSHEFLIQFIDLLYTESDRNKGRFESREEFEEVRKHNLIAKTLFSMDRQVLTCEACSYSSVTLAINSTILVEPRETIQLGIDQCYEEVKLEGKDAWKCDKCGKKKSSKKKIEILVHPEVLIIHISRFHPQGWKNTASVNIDDTLFFNNRKYSLFGVVCQNGTLSGGHYFAEAKRSGTWNVYNDEQVTKGSKTYSGAHPYIVFYAL
ncbi:ubiquitin carboxyl terminal hydrolase [Encephalitozoon intestinalis ATCC 50506]|uniref:Ubiquitin carboxyl terminal hydrolase n=1 Tax=Encephalitozoon intestinalis (strain ATCC 50506) TaxID=876142 RepID=E0S7W4_ENCIT|nr:ubiquitin carboxyl terminal hydrolase [Encephalitozoon intestinalis ATCC 50506]ADM11799.1 ubiquitin carboxyl terminal hydrolase [Encephalitozoon intestinalis ATCC 50506]UTX45548.1 ubiquitin carboxyl terminal hydrolase [Encephalitozoon intestinalis]